MDQLREAIELFRDGNLSGLEFTSAMIAPVVDSDLGKMIANTMLNAAVLGFLGIALLVPVLQHQIQGAADDISSVAEHYQTFEEVQFRPLQRQVTENTITLNNINDDVSSIEEDIRDIKEHLTP